MNEARNLDIDRISHDERKRCGSQCTATNWTLAK